MEKLLKSRYKITGKIGENPFCVTYKGILLGTQTPIVIKIYHRDILNSRLIKRLHQKGAQLSELTHPGIAKFIDGDYGWQGFYFVREYIQGKNLTELLNKEKRFNPEKAREIGIKMGEALLFARSRGVVHGALHPGNVFLSRQGVVKLTDFIVEGTMRSAFSQKAKAITQEAHFLSPEQIKGQAPKTSSDIYAMGLLLYYMLTGELAFKGENSLEVAFKILKEVPSPPTTINPDIPRGLEEITLKALEKDPILRFSSMEGLLESLKAHAVVFKKRKFEVPTIRYDVEEAAPSPPPAENQEELQAEKIGLSIKKSEEVRKGRYVKWISVAIGLAVATGLGYALLQVLLTR